MVKRNDELKFIKSSNEASNPKDIYYYNIYQYERAYFFMLFVAIILILYFLIT